MEVYLGRQPILDSGMKVAGYELLFRSSQVNACDSTDDVEATSQVIVNAVLGVGLDRLLGGKPAFINFDRTLLLGDWTTLLPPEKVVIEVLESVPPDQEVLAACDRLQRQGYAVALDDCLNDGRTAAFAPFVDILKVDFQLTSPVNQQQMAQRYKKLKIKMLAEKVETESEFRRAQQAGYDYFQGYFFARPTVMQAARLPASQATGLRLIKQIQREEMDFDAVADLIQHDVGLSHSLLKYLNSAAFHWADRVESVRRGLTLLGEDEIRKWAWMASLSGLGQNRPQVLMQQVLMRGRFCEAIARAGNLPLGNADPFLLGMFSLLDAILQRPLAGILSDLNIGTGIRGALLGTAGEDDLLKGILGIVKSYEVGDWRSVIGTAQGFGLSAEVLGTCYLESLAWVESVAADDQTGRIVRPQVPAGFHRTPRPLSEIRPVVRQ
jgi:EAL and modified HD-GYP domain-containing signal transduction protein